MSIDIFLDDDEQRALPSYDWRTFVDDADLFVRELRVPRKIHSSTNNNGRGLDLSHKCNELAMLIAEAHEVYDVALEAWATRRENSFSPNLEANYDPAEEIPPYGWPDYAAYQTTQADWDELYERHYKRPRGPSGKSRTRKQHDNGDLPTRPLWDIYILILQWWERHVGKPFNPDFNINKDTRGTDERKKLEWFNPAARVFLLIAQELNTSYTSINCHWIHDRLRKTVPKRKQRERRLEPTLSGGPRAAMIGGAVRRRFWRSSRA
ncbi:MAG: hypothetical protein AB7L36_04990 [Sphingomonadaceae bacterium]